MRRINQIVGSTIVDTRGPPYELYHYTDPQGIMGIVRSGKLWASSIQYLNDTQEFEYAVSVLRTVVTGEMRGSGDPSDEVLDLFLDEVEKFVESGVFVFSFSEEKDLLSQWRSYCPPSKGYALGFSSDGLRRTLGGTDFWLGRCLYMRDFQQDVLKALVQNYAEEHDFMDVSGQEERVEQVLHGFARRFAEVAPLLKHPSFAEEREWRLVSDPIGQLSERVEHREGGTGIVPYVPFDVAGEEGAIPLTEIVVGPTEYPDLTASAAASLFKSHSCGEVQIEVSRSTTPYREF